MEKDLDCETDSKSSSQCAAHLVQNCSIQWAVAETRAEVIVVLRRLCLHSLCSDYALLLVLSQLVFFKWCGESNLIP